MKLLKTIIASTVLAATLSTAHARELSPQSYYQGSYELVLWQGYNHVSKTLPEQFATGKECVDAVEAAQNAAVDEAKAQGHWIMGGTGQCRNRKVKG